MPSFEPPRPGRDDSDSPEGHNALGFKPADGWLSPFSRDRQESSLGLFGEFSILFPRPIGWIEIASPPNDTKLLLISPEGDATLGIAAGILPAGRPVKDALANIAASPLVGFRQAGARIPVVVSIPTISSIAGVDASHMLNFPATLPGSAVGMSEPQVQLFKYETVLAIGNKWVSFETTSWGKGCNPLTEVTLMGKLHSALRITKTA